MALWCEMKTGWNLIAPKAWEMHFWGLIKNTCYARRADELPKHKKYVSIPTGHKITTSHTKTITLYKSYPMLHSAHREQQKFCVQDTKPPMEDSMQKNVHTWVNWYTLPIKREIRRQFPIIRTMTFCSNSQIGGSKEQNPPAVT